MGARLIAALIQWNRDSGHSGNPSQFLPRRFFRNCLSKENKALSSLKLMIRSAQPKSNPPRPRCELSNPGNICTALLEIRHFSLRVDWGRQRGSFSLYLHCEISIFAQLCWWLHTFSPQTRVLMGSRAVRMVPALIISQCSLSPVGQSERSRKYVGVCEREQLLVIAAEKASNNNNLSSRPPLTLRARRWYCSQPFQYYLCLLNVRRVKSWSSLINRRQ